MYTTIYAHRCAECGEHTFRFHCGIHNDSQEYWWPCEKCGRQMKLVFSDGGRAVTQAPTPRRCDSTLVLFSVDGYPALKFIQDGIAWDGNLSGGRYYYEEHTCPSNIVKCREVFHHADDDPHGVFRVIHEVLVSGPNGMDEDAAIDLLSSIALGQTPAPQEP